LKATYSIFKRGMKGVYQRCKEKHLHRYLAEFDFRYSNRIAVGIDDQDRTEKALKGIAGKRLTYRSPSFSPGRLLRTGHGVIRASKRERKPRAVQR